MSVKYPKDLIWEAGEAVASASYCPKKLTLIHTGIAAAASFTVALLSYLLSLGMRETGGLSGMGTIAALETAQSILDMAVSLLSPFWAMGFIAAALQMARRESVTPHILLRGLHRWGPALRMLMSQGLIYFIIMLTTMQIGSFLFMLTPSASHLNELAQQLTQVDTMDVNAMNQIVQQMGEDTIMEIFWAMLPFMVLPAVIIIIPVAYRMRLAPYILMDEPRCGAVYAIAMSIRLTKKHCWQLFRLDLRFWWFYALEVLISVLCYGDLLLSLLGVELGMNGILASFLFYALALVCQLGLYVWKKPQIFTSYALFYHHLLPKEEEESE